MRRASSLAAGLVAALCVLSPDVFAQAVTFGPADGRDLPPVDIDRVGVGSVAPDFTLPVFRGGTFTLSDLRRSRNVVLVFYRGWW